MTVACAAGIDDHLPLLPIARLVRVTAPAPGQTGACFSLPSELADEADSPPGTLLIFVPIGLLSCWDTIGADTDRALERFERVTLVLVQPYFAVERIQDFSWVLSVMVSAFAPAQFDMRIEGLTLGADRHLTEYLVRLCFPSFWLRLPRQLMRYTGALLRRGLSYPISGADAGPERFSVLLVDLTRRRVDRSAAA